MFSIVFTQYYYYAANTDLRGQTGIIIIILPSSPRVPLLRKRVNKLLLVYEYSRQTRATYLLRFQCVYRYNNRKIFVDTYCVAIYTYKENVCICRCKIPTTNIIITIILYLNSLFFRPSASQPRLIHVFKTFSKNVQKKKSRSTIPEKRA